MKIIFMLSVYIFFVDGILLRLNFILLLYRHQGTTTKQHEKLCFEMLDSVFFSSVWSTFCTKAALEGTFREIYE